jgi:very-short-patch-repair endonuclease
MTTDMHYGASKTIFQYAESLRKNMTMAEKIIWERLCKNQHGVRIRRQHPVWKYIADYYCHNLKLIIEIDGGIHLSKENKEYDIGREITLNQFGIEIIRFTNDQVINEIEHVIEVIDEKITELKKNKSKSMINEEKLVKSLLSLSKDQEI